jgi:hypothetical protein
MAFVFGVVSFVCFSNAALFFWGSIKGRDLDRIVQNGCLIRAPSASLCRGVIHVGSKVMG